MSAFSPDVIAAVLHHMNDDHPEDSLIIARAYGRPNATQATMIGLDTTAGVWTVDEPAGMSELRVAWSGKISERAEIRREVVALYREACRRLGVAARE